MMTQSSNDTKERQYFINPPFSVIVVTRETTTYNTEHVVALIVSSFPPQIKWSCIPVKAACCCHAAVCPAVCHPPCFHAMRFHAISSPPWFPWLSSVSVVSHRKNSRVQINRAKLEDSGNYTCVVENSLGKDNSTGTVNVQSSEYTDSWATSEVAQMCIAVVIMTVLLPNG